MELVVNKNVAEADSMGDTMMDYEEPAPMKLGVKKLMLARYHERPETPAFSREAELVVPNTTCASTYEDIADKSSSPSPVLLPQPHVPSPQPSIHDDRMSNLIFRRGASSHLQGSHPGIVMPIPFHPRYMVPYAWAGGNMDLEKGKQLYETNMRRKEPPRSPLAQFDPIKPPVVTLDPPRQEPAALRNRSRRCSSSSSGGNSRLGNLLPPNSIFSDTEITNLNIEAFNEKMAQHNLTEEEQSLYRDSRRKGKNRDAAKKSREKRIKLINSLRQILAERQSSKELLQERVRTLEGELKNLPHLGSSFLQELLEEEQALRSMRKDGEA